jgi:hypothetical protein
VNQQSKIGMQLTAAVATGLAALAGIVPAAPAGRESGECRLPAWTHVVTGHWLGRDCR